MLISELLLLPSRDVGRQLDVSLLCRQTSIGIAIEADGDRNKPQTRMSIIADAA